MLRGDYYHDGVNRYSRRMIGGATPEQRGLADQVRELFPSGNSNSKIHKDINTILNLVVHDPNTDDITKRATSQGTFTDVMDVIKDIDDRPDAYGLAQPGTRTPYQKNASNILWDNGTAESSVFRSKRALEPGGDIRRVYEKIETGPVLTLTKAGLEQLTKAQKVQRHALAGESKYNPSPNAGIDIGERFLMEGITDEMLKQPAKPTKLLNAISAARRNMLSDLMFELEFLRDQFGTPDPEAPGVLSPTQKTDPAQLFKYVEQLKSNEGIIDGPAPEVVAAMSRKRSMQAQLEALKGSVKPSTLAGAPSGTSNAAAAPAGTVAP
jgi:hypothetical protein